jgi:uncharacterized protein YecE (DUF72 family)
MSSASSKALLKLGTSAWSNPSWVGVFYPDGTKPSEYLARYAEKYHCVEIDSTFYRVPTSTMIRKWYLDTPEGFLFAAKVAQVITHEKVMLDCEQDLAAFLKSISGLKEKLGPLLLQFPYFNKKAFESAQEFYRRLSPFLAGLPKEFQWALEIRNKYWITKELLDLLRQHQIAFSMIDQSWMPPIDQLLKRHDLDTAKFAYIRWLGDRKGIEEITKEWDKVVIDRQADLARWVLPVHQLLARGRQVYGFFNNHYAGHAPASLELFQQLLFPEKEESAAY